MKTVAFVYLCSTVSVFCLYKGEVVLSRKSVHSNNETFLPTRFPDTNYILYSLELYFVIDRFQWVVCDSEKPSLMLFTEQVIICIRFTVKGRVNIQTSPRG
jgi:hypothetical protein